LRASGDDLRCLALRCERLRVEERRLRSFRSLPFFARSLSLVLLSRSLAFPFFAFDLSLPLFLERSALCVRLLPRARLVTDVEALLAELGMPRPVGGPRPSGRPAGPWAPA